MKLENPKAFPNDWNIEDGMTLMTYSAIHLKQPISELEWLNKAIIQTKKDEFANSAMQSLLSGGINIKSEDYISEAYRYVAKNAFQIAYAMLKQREL